MAADHKPLTVCLCTHNPNRSRLCQALDAIARQSLDPSLWDLIVVDNHSDPPLRDWVDLAAIPNACLLTEPKLGLTPARLRAIAEASGHWLVFFDDDNLPETDYLEAALRIGRAYPFVGAFGGRCTGVFENPPPKWAVPYLHHLALGDFGSTSCWEHHPGHYAPWHPSGAGLVLRAEAAQTYQRQLHAQPERITLGRRGTALSGSEDLDMLQAVMDHGLAVGYFPELKLNHLVPLERLKLSYLSRLVFHTHYSAARLWILRRQSVPARRWPLDYLAGLGLQLLSGHGHPLTWWLTVQAVRGRYAALRDGRPGGITGKVEHERA